MTPLNSYFDFSAAGKVAQVEQEKPVDGIGQIPTAGWDYLKGGGEAGVLLAICFAGVVSILRTKSK